MELVGPEVMFMVRNTKQKSPLTTCARLGTMMYRVLSVFFEINPSSKCFQVSWNFLKEKIKYKIFYLLFYGQSINICNNFLN